MVDYGGVIVMVRGKGEAQARVDRHQKVNAMKRTTYAMKYLVPITAASHFRLL